MFDEAVFIGVITLAISSAIYIFRDALRTWVTRGIVHKFDREIELLRADLKAKDEKIAAIRQSALAGAGKRREALDKRQLEAIDKLWAAVNSLAPLKMASKYMETINFEKSSKLVGENANARKFFETIGKTIDITKMPRIEASKERPFISDRAWALYNAYSAILYYALMQLKTLEIGEDASQLLNHKNIDDLAKAALPHQAKNIEKMGTSFCHHLVEELEQSLLAALKSDLEGHKATEDDLRVAAQILDASDNVISELNAKAARS